MSKNTNSKPKTKTLYSSNKNIDISSLITHEGGAKKNKSTITKNKKNIKKNKNAKKSLKGNNSDDELSLNESEFGDSEQDEDESEISDSDNNDDDNIEEKENNYDDDDDNLDKDDGDEEEDDEKSSNDGSDIEEKDYIDNEEILKSKCYSKYARIDYDDLDFDELFNDNTINRIKDIKLTKPILTKYELVRLLTDRSKQLAEGSKPMLKNISGMSSKEIAKLELKNKIIPLLIERPVPNSGVERWKITELEIPEDFLSN